MATKEGSSYEGPVVIDLSPVKSQLVDLSPGAMKGMRAEQPGMPDVLKELGDSTQDQREDANIPEHVYQRILAQTADLATFRDYEAKLAKALEVVTETRTKIENDREDDIGILAKAARDTADRQKSAVAAAPFEKTIKYNSQIADKAVATRKKNAEAKQGAGQAPSQGAGQTPS